LDQWFKLEIRAEGNRLSIIVNDKPVADYVDDKNFAAGSPIGLQLDKQSVEFRNIEIKVLAFASPIAAAPKEGPGPGMSLPDEVHHLTGRFGCGFPSRANKARPMADGGGNKESEEAVAHGLKWLAKQQHKGGLLDPLNGSWECEGAAKSRVAATGI